MPVAWILRAVSGYGETDPLNEVKALDFRRDRQLSAT
jgi:hypothetical protein